MNKSKKDKKTYHLNNCVQNKNILQKGIIHCRSKEMAINLNELIGNIYDSKDEIEKIWDKYQQETCFLIGEDRGRKYTIIGGCSILDEYTKGRIILEYDEE